MSLLLDFGNSRLKWAWSGKDINESAGVAIHKGRDLPELLQDALGESSCDSVFVSNVLGKEAEKAIFSWFSKHKGLKPIFIATTSSAYGLKNAYTIPEQLGVDRWLAMIAASHTNPGPVCIVDCGSAATLDIVRDDGQHLGGLILPGLSMMRSALSANTSGAQWKAEDSEDKGCLGLDTQSCIALGTVSAIAGMVERTVHKFEQVYQMPLKVVVTGGDAQIVASKLQLDNKVQPHLVLEGLAIVAQQEA